MILSFIFLMYLFVGWVVKQTFGAEIKTSKTIALCFDDGPRPLVLEKLLPVLEKYKVPGNFFVIGAIAFNNMKILEKMHKDGHEIENHSWGHENFMKLYNWKGTNTVSESLLDTEVTIFNATGRKPRFFRPPFWAINKDVEKIIKGWGYTIMKLNDPDINTEDYEDFSKHRPPEVLIERVKSEVASRERQGKFNHVLVFHELPLTAEALKTLIPYFQAQGYKFIRLDEKY